jgi:hypothetical protein
LRTSPLVTPELRVHWLRVLPHLSEVQRGELAARSAAPHGTEGAGSRMTKPRVRVPRPASARVLGPRAAYRRWYAAAGPWVGFFRAVPLVALARGVGAHGPPPTSGRPAAEAAALAAEVVQAGQTEGWLSRPDALLVLDLPGVVGVEVALRLAPVGVRPVLLSLLWPEPGALVPADRMTEALVRGAPRARAAQPAQYALLLGRERGAATTPADLAAHFDNRYTLGDIDLPSPARLVTGGVRGVVACWEAALPIAPDLAHYLATLDGAGMPVRRLPLGAEQR